MKKILVTGGAGYIGSVLVRQLLKQGCRVRVVDSLRSGGDSLVELMGDEHFEFLRGDIRDKSVCCEAVEGIDAVMHLAAIVGDPACKKFADDAKSTNCAAAEQLYMAASEASVDRFIFASTCSNYGKMKDNGFVHEESELSPVSLYAETKVAFETFLLENASAKCAPTICRFSTVYGLSPRPRFDLTVNEFTREAAMGRELVIFGEQFWRPYCHVNDLGRSMIAVMEAERSRVSKRVYNVGDTSENYTKGMLCEELGKQFPKLKVSYVEKNEDPRDYRVNCDRIASELGFRITKRVPDGIREIANTISSGLISDPDSTAYKNV